MPVSEIRPGMVGIGRTVFDGTHVEEFKAHIIGVLENVIGTHRNLILAKLEGGPLANTGVIAGMSGSPVYIDGRLIGAVSYALGSFSKEPIAGITPIAEMTDVDRVQRRPAAPARASRSNSRSRATSLTAAFRKALNWNRPFADRPSDAQLRRRERDRRPRRRSARHAAAADRDAARHVRASSPTSPTCSAARSAIRASFRPAAAPAASHAGEMPFDGPLKPGDAVGVMLVSGDLQLGGTGTVTHIDGDRVYAFGHPMYNLGPTEFPMTRAYVYTVLPSLFSSMKLSTTGEVIGTFAAGSRDGDCRPPRRRAAADSGHRSSLESSARRKRTFNFGVVNDQLFTPLMTYASILNTLGSYERQFGVGDVQRARHGAREEARRDRVRQPLRRRSGVDGRRRLRRRRRSPT